MGGALLEILADQFEIDLVGQAFGIIEIKHLPIDVSVPRRESKIGSGYKGFAVQSDPGMSIEEAASRRDFTINSMSFDPLSGELFDSFGGLDHLSKRVLRHTSERFAGRQMCKSPLVC